MAIIRWQPWQEFDALRRQFDDLFDELAPISRVSSRINGHAWSPAIELKSTDDAVILRAELPGIKADDLDVQVTREAVSISGEYKSETKTEDKEHQIHRSEFRYGSFQRMIPLPVAVQNDQAKAEFKDGILTLTLPKVEAEKPKVVKVSVNGDAS
ncbi:molecular chaperone (small heat shock protein) [Leptolyngbyaceae cyanobacterium JSC-12]|nr:molecular chaperone (small heat shock protein) [Leptolyngbyaceae cyanobacterium JSC-12]